MGLYSDHIFPRFYDRVVRHKFFDESRARILRQAEGKILEIGIGTGINLQFYPQHVMRISAVDPNPGMERELKKKLGNQRVEVDFSLASAEEMPFEDSVFQTVVSTLTMCSIPDLPKALEEIKRVLRPGGQLIFLDHGLSRDPGVERFQRACNPIWKRIGCGCNLIVDVESELRKARFNISSLKTYYVPNAPKFVGHVYEGIAVRQ